LSLGAGGLCSQNTMCLGAEACVQVMLYLVAKACGHMMVVYVGVEVLCPHDVV
jgi:hypothetical protein